MRIILMILVLLVFAGCGQVADTPVDETIDTIAIATPEEAIAEELPETDVDVSALIRKAGNILELPYNLDSVKVESMDEEKWTRASTLTSAEVQYLASNFIDNVPTRSGSNATLKFFEIDSMRITGTYEEYVEQIDIGMIQFSEANILDRIQLNDGAFILLWTINFSSYEACPYYSGAVIYGTFFLNDVAHNTAVLGETSGGGDPPSWGNTIVTSDITASSIKTTTVDSYGEEDEDGEETVEVEKKTFSISISKEGFVVN